MRAARSAEAYRLLPPRPGRQQNALDSTIAVLPVQTRCRQRTAVRHLRGTGRFRHVLVDEVPGHNRTQYDLISSCWSTGGRRPEQFRRLGPALGVRSSATADQSIYSFRAADSRFLMGFQGRLRRSGQRRATPHDG